MSVGTSHVRTGTAARSRRLPRWSVVCLAVVAGLALGRFVTLDGDDGARSTSGPGPAASAGATLEDQVAALEGAVAADPEDAASWRALGSAYVRRATEVGDPSFYELAERSLQRAESLAPGDPGLLVVRGTLALALHQFDEALRLGTAATSALPANADALGVLVDAQVELGRYDEATDTLQQMLDARPGLPALARTSYLRELRGDLASAEEAMRAAVVAGTSSTFDVATVTALLGDVQRAGGDLPGALASYEDALRLVPGLVQAELGRASVLGARGEAEAAVEVVQRVVERFPTPAALFLLADLQSVTGDAAAEDETAALVRVTSSLQEEAGQVVDLELAVFEADLGDDPAAAVSLARAAHAARPDNVFAADALAWALLRAGDAPAALPFAEQAVRLGTANGVLQYHAAEVFAAAGQLDRAADHLERAYVGGPRFSIRHASAAADLAGRVGVDVPELP
jgi:tetratricopeptide (TPR) repeat protein